MPSVDFGKTPSLKQLVYDNLRSRIINGDLRPGARLLEGELSKDMDISRAPIREALNMLERDGLATIMPRRGAIVSVFTKEDVLYIWEMRELLEPYAAKISVGDIPEGELRQTEELLLAVQASPEDTQKYVDSDLAIHDLLYRHLKNHYLKAALLNLKAHSLCVRWNCERDTSESPTESEAFARTVTAEHFQILRALQARDGQAAYDAVKNHLIRSCKRTVDSTR